MILEYQLLYLNARDGQVSGLEGVWWVNYVGLGVPDLGVQVAGSGGRLVWGPPGVHVKVE